MGEGDGARQHAHRRPLVGRLLAGIEAFLAVWARLPRYRRLARVVGSRPVRPLAEAAYERVLAPLLYRLHRRRNLQARRARV